MNYGWGNLQPNQPPNGYCPPSNPAYPVAPGYGAGDGGIGSAYGAPQPPFGVNQPPFGANQQPFGASQPCFGATQQPPYGAPQPPFGANQQPFGASQPCFGATQQPPYGAPQPSLDPAQPSYGGQVPMPVNTGPSAIGFNALFNNLAQAQTPQPAALPSAPPAPSAPPMSPGDVAAPGPMASEVSQVEAGRRVNIVVVPSRRGGDNSDSMGRSATDYLNPGRYDPGGRPTRPDRPPSRRTPSPRPNTDGGTSQGRDESRSQGLKNMADLMTDVDINDEVLKSLKDKFDLR